MIKLLDRHQTAEKLGMTPAALSNHVSRRNWEAIPQPRKVGGRWKWLESDVERWVLDLFKIPAPSAPKKKGRPRKRPSGGGA